MHSMKGYLKTDFHRGLISQTFLAACLGCILIGFFGLRDEIGIGLNVSVVYYYHFIFMDFEILFLLLCALPFSTSFCTDWNNRYLPYSMIRGDARSYSISKVAICALSGFFVSFLAHLFILGVLALICPISLNGSMDNPAAVFGFAYLLDTGTPFFYFIFILLPKCLICGLIAVFALWISTKITNVFVVLASPIIFYYCWNNLTILLGLSYSYDLENVMEYGVAIVANPWLNLLAFFIIIAALVILLGILFYRGIKRRMCNG
jgi:hypothetical protein